MPAVNILFMKKKLIAVCFNCMLLMSALSAKTVKLYLSSSDKTFYHVDVLEASMYFLRFRDQNGQEFVFSGSYLITEDGLH